jgi:hypothetical protein
MEVRKTQTTHWDRGVRIESGAGPTANLAVCDKVVRVTEVSADYTLYLPPVELAAGNIYTITLLAQAGAFTLTLAISLLDPISSCLVNPSTGARTSSRALATADDFLCLYCDGLRWLSLTENIA